MKTQPVQLQKTISAQNADKLKLFNNEHLILLNEIGRTFQLLKFVSAFPFACSQICLGIACCQMSIKQVIMESI